MTAEHVSYFGVMALLGIGAGWSLGAMAAVTVPVLAWGAALFAVAFIVVATVVVMLGERADA